MSENSLFELQIISPQRIFYDAMADMLEVKTTEGDIGILKGHIPLTCILEPGVTRIRMGDEVKLAAVHGGFIKILGDKTIILADSCEWPEEINLTRAEEAKLRAEEDLKSKIQRTEQLQAELALRRALIRIELHQYH